MNLSYNDKEKIMESIFMLHKAPVGYRATWKNVPIDNYEQIKQFIDFTKYYIMFRGPRPRHNQSSTRKRDARAFDVYQRSYHETQLIRTEREAFRRGVDWAINH